MPPHVQELFGGTQPAAARRRGAPRAQARGQPGVHPRRDGGLPAAVAVERSETASARWAKAGEIRWLEELKRLSIEVICTTIMGHARRARRWTRCAATTRSLTGRLRHAADQHSRHALQQGAQGARPHPGCASRDTVRERRQTPTDDGLSRMLAARRRTRARRGRRRAGAAPHRHRRLHRLRASSARWCSS